jgi:hypothetical protein
MFGRYDCMIILFDMIDTNILIIIIIVNQFYTLILLFKNNNIKK